MGMKYGIKAPWVQGMTLNMVIARFSACVQLLHFHVINKLFSLQHNE